ncbi:MAG: LLM class flavin-dependent oxidoreductase, partial [Caldilineaceae bacterium]|nr:LLM class flavin-dependent oxidoreductase [Caldilineaceae bacterium]
MHPIQFGFCVPIFASPGGRLFRTANYAALDASVTMRMAQEADALGYDALWVADHLMLGQDNAILEGWTTLAALAGATRRARLGLIHQAHFFRQPALTAKMAATLDQ